MYRNKNNDNQDCSICLEKISNVFYKTTCDHLFHYNCIKKWFITNKNITCPYCRKKQDNIINYFLQLNNNDINDDINNDINNAVDVNNIDIDEILNNLTIGQTIRTSNNYNINVSLIRCILNIIFSICMFALFLSIYFDVVYDL